MLNVITPSERVFKELQNPCYIFENDYFKLKLWALKDSYQNQRNTKGQGTKAKIG